MVMRISETGYVLKVRPSEFAEGCDVGYGWECLWKEQVWGE